MATVVLGLDGASFELIDPWIEDGSLPAMGRLVEEGAASDLQSVLPPVTCPNWHAYATGRNPGKLGVFWWERVDRERETMISTNTADYFDGTHYWQYLDGESGVVNLPTSYPPDEVDGVHVAGGPGAEQSGYTYPPDLESRLEREHDYRVHPTRLGELSAENRDSACVEEIYDLIDARFDVAEDLLEEGRYELIHVTAFYLNVLHHFFWNDELVKEAWVRIDERIERLLDHEAVDRLFVMSDHGSNEIDTSFRVNAWLEANGYLETTSSLSDWLYKFGLTRERVRPVIASLGIEWFLRRIVPRNLQNALPDESGAVTQGAKASVVDWDASTAIASGQGPVYVLADDPRERERIRDELVEELDGLTHEGREVISGAYPAEEVYDGPYVDEGPDVLLDQAPGVHIEGKIGNADPFGDPGPWRGENKREGLFAAYGPEIDPDAELEGMQITELAPTLLHRHGAAVPADMDHPPRTELFADGTDPAERDVEFASGDSAVDDDAELGPDTDVESRLNDLGYLE
ncbi:nucleotide pyrophosphatase [Halobacteriales archaeon QS_1_68_20]|nr:MAG: nucleotide pyrophosphatase [Halobacteriales archaeon QS_1_68_20]